MRQIEEEIELFWSIDHVRPVSTSESTRARLVEGPVNLGKQASSEAEAKSWSRRDNETMRIATVVAACRSAMAHSTTAVLTNKNLS